MATSAHAKHRVVKVGDETLAQQKKGGRGQRSNTNLVSVAKSRRLVTSAFMRKKYYGEAVVVFGKATEATRSQKNVLVRKPRSAVDEMRERGIALLNKQVQRMVEESGNPAGFDAAAWVGEWLQKPNSALGGDRPSKFMGTADGQQMISRLLAQAQSGAYA